MNASFGFDFGDVLGAIEAPFITAGNAVAAIVKAVPGGTWIEDALGSGKTWIGDMARTPWGFTALTLIAGQLEIGVGGAAAGGGATAAGALGPQIASVAWGLPGFLKGDCFSAAYVQEFGRRLKQLAEYFGGSGLGDSVSAEIDQLVNDSGFVDLLRQAKAQGAALGVNVDTPSGTKDALSKAGLNPDVLAARFGKRADSAANAANLVLCAQVYDTSTFDPASGGSSLNPTLPANAALGGALVDITAKGLLPVPPLAGAPTASEVLTAILLAQNAGVSDDRLGRLKAQYETLFAAESPPIGGGAPPPAPGVLVGSPSFATTTFLVSVLQLAAATAPAWGTLLLLRHRKRR